MPEDWAREWVEGLWGGEGGGLVEGRSGEGEEGLGGLD